MRDFLTRDELRKLRHKLAHLSPYDVKAFYQQRWEACRLQQGIPKPHVLQELVTAWKLLRRMKSR